MVVKTVSIQAAKRRLKGLGATRAPNAPLPPLLLTPAKGVLGGGKAARIDQASDAVTVCPVRNGSGRRHSSRAIITLAATGFHSQQ